MADRHGISKENMLDLNRYGYFERVPFAKFNPEFDVGFDHARQLQLAELFKRLFTVELMVLGSTNQPTLGVFSAVSTSVKDRTFKDTVSFEKLQEMAGRCRQVPEDSVREETYWLEGLQWADPKCDYLVDRSVSGSPSENLDITPSDRELRIGTLEPLIEGSSQERGKGKICSGLLFRW
jgi:DNA ligase-4